MQIPNAPPAFDYEKAETLLTAFALVLVNAEATMPRPHIILTMIAALAAYTCQTQDEVNRLTILLAEPFRRRGLL